jgi:chromosomal replication initiation ATPase DnaA
MKQGITVHIGGPSKRNPTAKEKVDGIIKAVEEYYGVDTFQKTRKRTVVFARYTIMYLLIKFARFGVNAAAQIYDMDHSSAVCGKRVVADLCAVDTEIKRQIIEIETLIGQ